MTSPGSGATEPVGPVVFHALFSLIGRGGRGGGGQPCGRSRARDRGCWFLRLHKSLLYVSTGVPFTSFDSCKSGKSGFSTDDPFSPPVYAKLHFLPLQQYRNGPPSMRARPERDATRAGLLDDRGPEHNATRAGQRRPERNATRAGPKCDDTRAGRRGPECNAMTPGPEGDEGRSPVLAHFLVETFRIPKRADSAGPHAAWGWWVPFGEPRGVQQGLKKWSVAQWLDRHQKRVGPP